jgi:hypothetical protein
MALELPCYSHSGQLKVQIRFSCFYLPVQTEFIFSCTSHSRVDIERQRASCIR